MAWRNPWFVSLVGIAVFFVLFLVTVYLVEGQWDVTAALGTTALVALLGLIGNRIRRARSGD